MNFLEMPQWEVLDEVKTETTIMELLKKDPRSAHLNFSFSCFNWADAINKKGLEFTQNYINMFREMVEHPNRLIFVCQHISVNQLNWGDSIVFTPHASQEDNFYAIPHYAINCGKSKPTKDRKFKASFVGSFETHHSRPSSSVTIQDREDCFVKNTGGWHFYRDDRDESERFYCDMLSDSKVCLCPRGTGPSTIRLWEALASGCVPLLITDSSKLPLEESVNWNELIIKIQPHLAPLTSNILDTIDDDEISEKSKKCLEVYNKKFSNEMLHTSVIEVLEKYAN